MPNNAEGNYVDIYLLPVPLANLDAYREQATTFGQVAKEYGALSYREFVSDDPGEGMTAEEGTALTAAVAEFSSRAHRDEVMGNVLADPRVEALMQGESPADMT
ncbi:MAG: DUF1428 family protein, partial [Frankiaceae bacterium]